MSDAVCGTKVKRHFVTSWGITNDSLKANSLEKYRKSTSALTEAEVKKNKRSEGVEHLTQTPSLLLSSTFHAFFAERLVEVDV